MIVSKAPLKAEFDAACKDLAFDIELRLRKALSDNVAWMSEYAPKKINEVFASHPNAMFTEDEARTIQKALNLFSVYSLAQANKAAMQGQDDSEHLLNATDADLLNERFQEHK